MRGGSGIASLPDYSWVDVVQVREGCDDIAAEPVSGRM
jgi:hypothetical protein